MDLHHEVRLRLHEIDQRYTPGRRAIVDALAGAGRPLTIPDVSQRSGVPSSSAYRNVLVLVEAGVVHRVAGADDHARFELAEPLSTHHHHLICDNCSAVVDVAASPSLERALDTAAKAIVAETGLVVRAHRIDLYGRCADCA